MHALDAIDNAISLTNNEYDFLLFRSEIFYFIKDYKTSKRYFLDLLKKYPNDCKVLLYLSKICFYEDDYENAATYITKVSNAGYNINKLKNDPIFKQLLTITS